MFSCIRTLIREEAGCTFDQMEFLQPYIFEQYVYTYTPGIDVSFDEVLAGFETSVPVGIGS